MKADEILTRMPLTDTECALMYRHVILLFEFAEPDDRAFRLYDDRIQNYCKSTGLKIRPRTHVAEVEAFCRNRKRLPFEYPAGLIVFSHSGQNQLRQLIRHMRNACAHGHIHVSTHNGKEYFEFEQLDAKQSKIKMWALIPRGVFKEFWDTITATLTFKIRK